MNEKKLNNSQKVFWFTGLSGAGKTTIAEGLVKLLDHENFKIEIIDGDVVRNSIHKNLGFSKKDILLNNQLIAELCKKKLEESDVDLILVPIISPFAEGRDNAKQIIGEDRFRLIYFSADLEIVSKRDVKGLYAKAAAGAIDNMIGVAENSPYIPPVNFDFEINSRKEMLNESIEKLKSYVEILFNLS